MLDHVGINARYEKYENYSIKLDTFWPFGLPENDSQVDKEMKFKIETGIPTPSKSGVIQSQRTKDAIETMQALEIGQSFLIPVAEGEKPANVMSILIPYKKRTPDKLFITRTINDESGKPTSIRVWRIEK